MSTWYVDGKKLVETCQFSSLLYISVVKGYLVVVGETRRVITFKVLLLHFIACTKSTDRSHYQIIPTSDQKSSLCVTNLG